MDHGASDKDRNASHDEASQAAQQALHASMLQLLHAISQQLQGAEVLLTVNANLSHPLPPALAEDTIVQLQRIWTSDAMHYPVTGSKAKPLTAWTRQLLVQGQVFVGEGEQAIRTHFNDHATILGMGLRSVINTPLCDAQGRCFATINVLAPCPQWAASDVQAIPGLARHSAAAVQAYCTHMHRA